MEKVIVSALTKLDIQSTWDAWTKPEHIIHWTFASDDWHSPRAQSDLRPEGRFLTRMEAKDGSMGFDFEGTFLRVNAPFLLEYRMDDGRIAEVVFESKPEGTLITESFDPENIHPVEMQKAGWQSILDNFVLYTQRLIP
jgi:uncharacterized protein YndB with AHSA1/START domain